MSWRPVNRRDFVADLARLAALAAVVPNDWRVTRRPRLRDDPFQLGVASGDPTSDGGVLWTRLAPRPLEPEGGMDGQRTVVAWQVAEDEQFGRVVARGRATAAPELGYSVHVDVTGLAPARWYYYRFAVGDALSPVGRLRTAPAAGAAAPLQFAVVSCNHYEQGLFTAFGHLAREPELDLVTHLGDYIYEYAGAPGRVRQHAGLEIRTVDDYRRRYGQYKADPLLRAAHERCPWVVTWDDHEVDNNYAGLIGEDGMESDEQMRARRAAGYQAWWEHQPVRVPRARSWADLNITRTFDWGALARFWVLDTRQYRSDQACGDGHQVPCAEWRDPSRTLLGAAQERWLLDGLASSRAGWQVLAQQIMLAPFDEDEGAGTKFSMDQWSGYPAARERLLGAVAQRARNRTVVLTGDIHSSWVNELRSSFSTPNAPTVGAEFVGTSISSGGDGGESTGIVNDATRAANPHIKWHNARRGYFTCTVTPELWRTEYRVVPFVTRPDAPVETPTRWRVTRGRPGIERE